MMLTKKWNDYGSKFYKLRFVNMVILFTSLVLYYQVADLPLPLYTTLFYISFTFNLFFIIYEGLQMRIQGLDYFKSIQNLIDFGRLAMIAFATIQTHFFEVTVPEFEAVMFFLMWLKLLYYMQVFDSVRYFIKMIIEIIREIQVFIMILFIGMIAYA